MNANSLWYAAEAAADRRDWKQAEHQYHAALDLQPDHVPSLIGLSTVLTRKDAHREAHDAAMAAWRCRPQDPALVYALAQRLRYFHEFQALEECLAAPRFSAEAPAQVVAKGVVMLSSIGAHEAAVRMADQGLARDSRNAALLYVRGNLHLFSGENAEAEECYEASLRIDDKLFQNSWMLAGARTQTAESNHVTRIERQLTQARPGGEGEAYLSFGLHKELHDLGEYDRAWQALARGCAAKRKNVVYSLDEDRALVDDIISLCTAEFFETRSSVSQPSIPIFIVGMHRSGTTLLERMLSGHSQVGDAGETGAFLAAMQLAVDHALPGRVDPELLSRAGSIDYDEVARIYAKSVLWLSRGKPFFTEKLPMNFWNVGFITKALPQARILNLVRDPIDTCFSNLRTLFAGVAMYSYDQMELAGFYGEYRRLMEHWHSTLPGRVLDVRYSELVEQPQAAMEQIAAFCGIDYQPSLVDVSRATGRVATASATLARQGIRKDRGDLWRHYEGHLGPLIGALQPFYAA